MIRRVWVRVFVRVHARPIKPKHPPAQCPTQKHYLKALHVGLDEPAALKRERLLLAPHLGDERERRGAAVCRHDDKHDRQAAARRLEALQRGVEKLAEHVRREQRHCEVAERKLRERLGGAAGAGGGAGEGGVDEDDMLV